MYFPDLENESGGYKDDLYRQILIAKIELLVEESEENLTTFENLCKQYKSISRPLIFWQGHKKNTWVKFLKHFEYLYSVLEESGFKAPKELTVFEFYNKLEFIKQRAKEAEKRNK